MSRLCVSMCVCARVILLQSIMFETRGLVLGHFMYIVYTQYMERSGDQITQGIYSISYREIHTILY